MTNSPESNPSQSLYDWTQIIYGLHALSLVIGIVSAAAIITSFLIGVPSIIAVIMNYMKRAEADGTWLESHFRWQIRTFWSGVIWVALCSLFVVRLPLGILGLWFVYRIARGWLALRDRRPMYA